MCARGLVVELLNAFAKISLGDSDAAILKERAHFAFFRQHGF